MSGRGERAGMERFVNREEELSRLRALYDSGEPEFAVVYGRRRLGKTELVRRSLDDRENGVLFQATETTKQVQLDQFVEEAAETFPGVARIKPDWEPLVAHLAEQDAIIVLDEFPYLVDADESLPSTLQRLWDHELQDTAVTIVLVGSSIGMMEEAALLGNSPLYGRCTAKLDLRQLPFDAAVEFFPATYSTEEQIFAWGIFGGTPYYLEAIDLDGNLSEIVFEAILSRYGFLHDEPEYVLRMELTEPNRYFSILKAIASGKTRANEIAQAVGIETGHLSNYTRKLERLRIVEREVPITEEPERSRRGRYRIRDPLFRFWFRFIYGYENRYEQLGEQAYSTLIEPELPDFLSERFERLCQNALRNLYPEYTITDVGRWWYRDSEVDVVGLTTSDTLLVGECKFTNSPLDYSALSKLEDHADEIRWTPDGGGPVEREYALFSRNGFTQSVREAADEREDLRLFALEDVIEAF